MFTVPTFSINNGLGNTGDFFGKNYHSDGKTPRTEAGKAYQMAVFLGTDEGKEYLEQQKKNIQQRKASLLGARKAAKSVGYNSSTVFGGGQTDETGVILG